jgi:hypothetical protein
MKKTAILAILAVLLLIAGCTTTSSPPNPPATILPSTANPLAGGKILPMTGNISLGSGNQTIDVALNSIEVEPVQENGDQFITIYVTAINTGTKQVQLVWYSKLTDQNGKMYGGVGISHGGNGARSKWILPGNGDIPRDYVVVRSDRDLATLSKGAVLDVYFMNKPSDDIPVSDVPDYHVAWTVNPGIIR